MDIVQIISEIESTHCGACKYGLAMKALRELLTSEQKLFSAGITIQTLPVSAPPPEPQRHGKKHSKSKGDFEKACNKCHVVKPLTAYDLNKLCRDGHIGTCRECRREQQRAVAKKRKQSASVPPLIDKIAADTKRLQTESRFRCEPCHATFTSQKALDDHHCLSAHQGKS